MFRNFPGLLLRRPLARRRHQPPLAHAQPARECPLAHLHVVVLRPREVMQRKDKLLRRHDPQIRLQPAFEPHARLRLAPRRNLLHPRPGAEPVHHRPDLGRRHQEIQVAHGFQPAAQAARRLRPRHLRQCAQSGRNRRGHRLGIPPQVTFAIGLAVADALEDLLLRLLPKAVERRHPSVGARGREFRQRFQPELLMEHLDFFRSQPRHLQHLQQARLDRSPELGQKLEAAGGVQLGDFLRQRLADALDALEPLVRDQPRQLRLLDRLESPRTRLIGAHLERILALQLQQGGDLVQRVGNFVLGHVAEFCPWNTRNTRKFSSRRVGNGTI